MTVTAFILTTTKAFSFRESCPKPISKPTKTCGQIAKLDGQVCKYYKSEIRYIHSLNDVFTKAYVYYSPNYWSEDCAKKGRILDFFFHGSAGSYLGRMHDEYTAGDCRVSVAPKYENEDPNYYTYNKLRHSSLELQKEILSHYVNKVVKSLEQNVCSVFKEVTLTGHSQGGVPLSSFAISFPSGEIDGRYQIKGYFAADSLYFQNLDYFNVYFLNRLKHEMLYHPNTLDFEYVKDDVLKTYLPLVVRFDKYTKTQLRDMITDIFDRTLTEVLTIPDLTGWDPPLYFASAYDTMWGHQQSLHEFVSASQSPLCGFYGTRMIRFDHNNPRYWGNQPWYKKPSHKNYHWVASSLFIKEVLKYFDGVGKCY